MGKVLPRNSEFNVIQSLTEMYVMSDQEFF